VNINLKSLLLVEDHLPTRVELLNALVGMELEIESALRFSRAKEWIAQRPFDFVVTELSLAHCVETSEDGIQFAHHTKILWPETQVILLTPDPAAAYERFLGQGLPLPWIVKKPIDPVHLRQVFERSLLLPDLSLQRLNVA
jgi:DNA-binding NtrC family response regulator